MSDIFDLMDEDIIQERTYNPKRKEELLKLGDYKIDYYKMQVLRVKFYNVESEIMEYVNVTKHYEAVKVLIENIDIEGLVKERVCLWDLKSLKTDCCKRLGSKDCIDCWEMEFNRGDKDE